MQKFLFVALAALALIACSSSTTSPTDDMTTPDENTPTDKDQVLPDITDGGDTATTDGDTTTTDDLMTDDGIQSDGADTATDADEPLSEADGIATDDIITDDLLSDDAALPDDDVSQCTSIPEPEPAAADPMPTFYNGKVETVTNNGFTDHYLYSNASDYLKVGIRENWGASIVFFGIAANANSNVIDANDTGREVQVAFYDPARSMQGCAYNASCQTNPELICANSIRYLGWDPVQGGNRCNNGSPVESVNVVPGELTAIVRPLFWNPDWDQVGCGGDGCTDNILKYRQSDVRYYQRLRFVGEHIVEMRMTVENLTATAVQATLQEFPTLYAAYGAYGLANLHDILDSTGTQIAVDIPANDGFFYRNFETPGGWATLQNDERTYGVGIYYENRLTAYQAWQKEGVFNNIRSQFSFGIPANGSVTARAYLMLGSFDTIKTTAEALDAALPPFGVIDAPAADGVYSGTLAVNGWVLDNKGVTALMLLIDGTEHAVLPLDTARPDVCLVYPGYGMCTGNMGYSQEVSLAGLSPCQHIIEVRATDTDGNQRIIARRRITVK